MGTINNDHCECPFFDQESNPFAPEPPKTTTSYVSHVWSSVLTVKDNFVSTLRRRKRSSSYTKMSTIQSRGQTKWQRENHAKLTWKFRWKSCSSTYHNPQFLPSNPIQSKSFSQKLFPPKWSLPSKCPAKEKKGQEKQLERRGEKALLLRILKLQFSKLIVCYGNRTKATKCTTCKRLFIGRF